jgi:hypothetical protein
VMLSEALLERRRWKGLRCAREAMELRRFMEVRLESEDGATSLERDLRDGMLLPFGLSVAEDDGCVVWFVSWKRRRFCLRGLQQDQQSRLPPVLRKDRAG